MKTAILTIFCLIPLAACTTAVDDPFLQTSALKTGGAGLSASVLPENALAVIPAGMPTSVRQTPGENSVEQTIVFANATDLPGENVLQIDIAERSSGAAFRNAPSKYEVEAEMRAALPGTPMRIRQEIGENAHGVFGYATGPLGKSGSCLYAWQVARGVGSASGFAGLSSGYAARIRLRYCNPSMTETDSVALMQGLRIKPVTQATFAAPQMASVSMTVPVLTAAPVTQPSFQVSDPQVAPVKSVRRPSKAVAKSARDETSAPVEQATAARIPMPGDTSGISTVSAKPTPSSDETPVVAVKSATIPMPGTVPVAE